jgi:TonB-dependent starch-binding outer membrane protein SusC
MQVFATSNACPASGGRFVPLTLKYRQAVRIMKITGILILAVCMQVSANGISQTITINVKNEPILSVMKAIEKQTDYVFFYEAELLKNAKKVTVAAVNSPLQQILELCFKEQPFTYSITGKYIAIVPRKKDFIETTITKITKIESIIINVQGTVYNDQGSPVADVTVSVKNGALSTKTNEKGEFLLAGINEKDVLVFTHISFQTIEIPVDGKIKLSVSLSTKINELTNVIVSSASTGYQEIPKERATGSFVKINNELLNRRVSTSILDRLEGVASGVLFPNKNIPGGSNESPISIRGRSTILANTQPLVVVDNFPYDGDINNINPNTVESITLLKDAAAASIWGVRSSNGVIVITTKKSKYSESLKIEVNSNVTIGGKPDLFYDPQFLNSADFIGVEQFLFKNGFYDANLNNTSTRPIISPVVETLSKRRAGIISTEDSANEINALMNNDIRNDFNKYFFRHRINQQHSIGIQGGSSKANYFCSFGYDKNLTNLKNNDYSRYTFNLSNSFKPLNNLELSLILSYTHSTSTNNNPQPGGDALNIPYIQLADGSGQSIAIPRDYRLNYIDTTGSGNLLDWKYRPIEELQLMNTKTQLNDLRLAPSLKYTITKGLSFELRYAHEKQFSDNRNLQSQHTYFTRNLINLYTQPNGKRPIPLGDIFDQTNSKLTSNRFRAQLNFDNTFSNKHAITAIAGIESSEIEFESSRSRLYGYNGDNLQTSVINYDSVFLKWQNIRSRGTVPNNISLSKTTDVNISYFTNGSYTFQNKYTASISARMDQSNLFGVETNLKTVPLYSAGLSWNISNENFYSLKSMPALKLRATWGFNANIDKNVSAYTTAVYVTAPTDVGLNFATVTNPPNPKLRWEKSRVLNIGLDFEIIDRILSGSVESYWRNGYDLIGNAPTTPSAGVTTFRGNVAKMKGKGIDVDLTSRNINMNLKWFTNFLFSYNTDYVTEYNPRISAIGFVQSGAGAVSNLITPFVRRPVYSVYSYKWGGLNPNTGDPQGYLKEIVSNNFSQLLSVAPSELIYNGPARPQIFGSLINTFSYNNISISINITYKFRYYFRRTALSYDELYRLWIGHSDFIKRWQKPGDELTTNVPSMIYPNNSSRDLFYKYSEATVEKGDHIRLQDIRVTYDFSKLRRLSIENIKLYLYATNLKILWKRNKIGLDPDFISGYPTPASIAIGAKVNF